MNTMIPSLSGIAHPKMEIKSLLFTTPSLIATLSPIHKGFFHDLLQFTSPLPQKYKVTVYSEIGIFNKKFIMVIENHSYLLPSYPSI